MADSSVLNREIRQIEIALVSSVIAPPADAGLTARKETLPVAVTEIVVPDIAADVEPVQSPGVDREGLGLAEPTKIEVASGRGRLTRQLGQDIRCAARPGNGPPQLRGLYPSHGIEDHGSCVYNLGSQPEESSQHESADAHAA